MNTWIIRPKEQVIEPAIAPEFFVNSFGGHERDGDNILSYLCVTRLPIGADEAPQRIVQVKLIRPISFLMTTIAEYAQCIESAAERSTGRWPRLVT